MLLEPRVLLNICSPECESSSAHEAGRQGWIPCFAAENTRTSRTIMSSGAGAAAHLPGAEVQAAIGDGQRDGGTKYARLHVGGHVVVALVRVHPRRLRALCGAADCVSLSTPLSLALARNVSKAQADLQLSHPSALRISRYVRYDSRVNGAQASSTVMPAPRSATNSEGNPEQMGGGELADIASQGSFVEAWV